MNLKERFIDECFSKGNGKPIKNIEVIVTLVKLPTNSIEVIVNHQNIDSKLEYIRDAYDDNFCLKHNSKVEIVGYTVY